jgi:methylmalonyl-CoA/ethylmalonyl-CoA epimerase
VRSEPIAPQQVHVTRVDHVAIAVEDLAAAARLYVDVLGARFLNGGDNDQAGMRVAQFGMPGFKIELLQPLGEDSLLAQSMRRNGTGLHHVTFAVDDVVETDRRLRQSGYETTGLTISNPVWHETFIKPALTAGALIQFFSSSTDWSVPALDYGLDDVIAGRILSDNYVVCLRETLELLT